MQTASVLNSNTYPAFDLPANTPAWAVIDMPELLPAMELAGAPEFSRGAAAMDARAFQSRRQAIREIEDIRRVSARLFPQKLPQLPGLAYAGVCVEARHAGGDFYDFYERGPHRLGFVIGDVSGKGMASALVRATLQASLRTLGSLGVDDFEHSLAVVNRLLFESTPEAMYATLFFAEYDAGTRRLRYVNCGHPAPLLCGPGGVSRLESTAQVVGLFSEWRCSVGEAQLEAGDTSLLYTDGVSEATDEYGEEFGDARLIAMLDAQSQLPVSALLQECVHEVCRFGASDQRDDLTLVALRGIEG